MVGNLCGCVCVYLRRQICQFVGDPASLSGCYRAIQSATISLNGEIIHLRSFSELERALLCSYGLSYHTTLLPSLFPFEGSTQPVQVRGEGQGEGKGRGF